jgi:hypothetical protein
MMNEEYIEPGIYRDVQGTTVDVTQRPDGRYEIDYGNDMKHVFSARTIRKCYPIAVALVASAALVCAGVASAATPKQVRKAKAIVTHTLKTDPAAAPNFVGGTPTYRVTCRSTGATTIGCTIDAPSVNGVVATFVVQGGKLHETSGPGVEAAG